MNDYSRVIKFYESEVNELVKKYFHKKNMGQTENYILHIESILADSLMVTNDFKRASKVFYSLCKYYNNVKIKTHKFED